MSENSSTFIRLGQETELPMDALQLSRILEEHSVSKAQINLEKNDLSLPVIREASILQARKRIKESITPDRNLIQIIESIDEAHVISNLLSERISTWYSQITGKPRTEINKLVNLKKLPSQLFNIVEHFNKTTKIIKQYSDYLDEKAPKVFPHLVTLLGVQLAVRIVASAGQLAKLARMPSSTIQVLGAEKALFRHISEGTPPPKHGLIYQHPDIKLAKKKNRGRVSRKLAAKAAIASKLDYYGDSNGETNRIQF